MSVFSVDDPGPFCGTELTLLNRCRAHGIACREEVGMFLMDLPAEAGIRITGASPRPQATLPPAARRPRIALYCGHAIGYPYWGYYAHALLAIGLTFRPVSADEVAAGGLKDMSALIIPGGFATWGLDRAEGIDGVDAAIHRFILGGGALLGSCGGAFYASTGRPGWLGVLDAMPKYTQEYLMPGSGLVSISLEDGPLANGLPEALEMPYYHGPLYAPGPRKAETLGRFRTHIQENRLFIDNPLKADFFRAEMEGTPAVLSAPLGKGKVLVFSPHPEMGEFVRKGMVLESYVRHFLPIRGHEVMDQTLRFLAKDDSAGFRLIHNALGVLGLFDAADGPEAEPEAADIDAGALAAALAAVDAALDTADAQIDARLAAETPAMQALIRADLARRRDEWREVLDGLVARCAAPALPDGLIAGLTMVLRAAAESFPPAASVAENLVLAELPVRLGAAALRLVRCDDLLRSGT